MVLSAKVSSRNQISIPSEARRRLGIEPGDRLSVEIVDETMVLRRRPQRASDRLWGIAAGKGWYEPDPVTYVRELRDELEADLIEREKLVHPRD
ncbi:MAG TPA: AbrB/MazE/SpoVT family DNA-binding domain-containing protein [Candidatus Limnocylindrales bacterium]